MDQRVLVAWLLAVSLAIPVAAQADGDPLSLQVHAGGVRDVVALEPMDPRSDALAAAGARIPGLLGGPLAGNEGYVHLVWTPTVSLGLLAVADDLVWVTVDQDALVPYTAAPSAAGDHLDAEPTAPGPPGLVQPASHNVDAVLQLLVDIDHAYQQRWEGGGDEHVLRILHLVEAIYQAHFDITLEVVEQHVWTEPDPFDASLLCGQGGRLEQFRTYWEERAPTTSDPREAAHLFMGDTGEKFWGCAYIRQLETPLAYGVSHISGPHVGNHQLMRDVYLVAHELGHNFGGVHEASVGFSCAGSTLMRPDICTSKVPTFAAMNLLAMESYSQQRI